jgi:hypothetical protein
VGGHSALNVENQWIQKVISVPKRMATTIEIRLKLSGDFLQVEVQRGKLPVSRRINDPAP